MTFDGVVWWIVVPLAAIVAELVAVVTGKGTPLTAVWRHYVGRYRVGSAITGAFLVWLPVHWLFVSSGLAWSVDGTALAIGALVGLAGHWRRHRGDEDG